MGVFSMVTRLGLAKKAVDMARKPENQQKVRDLIVKMRSKRS